MAPIQPQDAKAKSCEELQLVVFNIGTEEFGVEIMNVQEIIRMTNITKIPQASGYVKGIINLRGRIIVVINLILKVRIIPAPEKIASCLL